MPREQSMQVRLLPPGAGSLAGGFATGPVGTIYVQSAKGGISATLSSGFTVTFGRNEPDVHVCVGEDDPFVSRQHGSLSPEGRSWTLRNDGRLPLLLPGSVSLLSGQSRSLVDGYTPLFIRTSPRRSHLVEVLVTPQRGRTRRQRSAMTTRPRNNTSSSPRPNGSSWSC